MALEDVYDQLHRERLPPKVHSQLASPPEQFPFLPEAISFLEDCVQDYRSDLIAESRRIGRRSNAGAVSEYYVNSAVYNLRNRFRSVLSRLCGLVGGLPLCYGLDRFLVRGQQTHQPGLLEALLIAVGALMIGISVANDLPRMD
jgi:hypothetical protein